MASTALLLGDVEIGAGAGLAALADGIENALRAGDITLGGAQAVLRGQHLEIGIGDGCECRQRDGVAVEPVGVGGLLRRLQRVAVLAPEIELIAGAERR